MDCCLLQICCDRASQEKAFRKALKASVKDPAKADRIADATFEEFAAVTEKIAAMAKQD